MKAALRQILKSIALSVPQIKRVHEHLLSAHKANADLRVLNERLKGANAAIGQQLVDAMSGKSTAAKSLDSALAEIERLKKEATDLKGVQDPALGAPPDQMVRRRDDLERIATLESQLALTCSELVSLQASAARSLRVEAQLAATESERDIALQNQRAAEEAASSAEAALAETLQSLAEDRKTGELRLAREQAHGSILASDVAQLQALVVHLSRSKAEAASKDIQTAREHVSALQAALQEQTDAAATAQRESADLAAERASLQDRLAQLESEVSLARQMAELASEFEGQAKAASARIIAAETATAAIARDMANFQVNAESSIEAVRAELAQSVALREETLAALSAAQQHVTELAFDLEQMQAERDRANFNLHVSGPENLARILGKLSQVQDELTHKSEVPETTSSQDIRSVRNSYLDLLEAALTGALYKDKAISPWSNGRYDPEVRALGRDWPAHAQTMIGQVRMRNLRRTLERVISDGVEGDFIETGVWRGGACIYASGILAAYGEKSRTIWVADSFAGLPAPSPEQFPADLNDPHHTFEELRVSANDVRANFKVYGLLDSRVKFLEGWFKDTLHSAAIEKLAVLRLDGDMYESTTQALEALYHKVASGGFVIVDDYGLGPCRQAITDFRVKLGIVDPIEEVDGACVMWRKSMRTTSAHSAKRNVAPDA